MSGDRTYKIAGVTLELEPGRPDLETLLPAAFGGFASPGEPSFRICLEEEPEMEADPLGFFLPYHFELREDGTDYAFVNVIDEVRPLGSIFLEREEARLRLPPAGYDWSDPDVASAVSMGLSDFLKTCLQVRLLEPGGTLMHASGVEKERRGYVFLGPSGAGKSTAARLSEEVEGVTVLNDDMVAVRLGEAGPVLHATPWTGSKGGSCSPGRAPLACIFCLRRKGLDGWDGREEGFRLERMDGKSALKELLANLPWLGSSERLADATISLAVRLAVAAPLYTLSFSLQEDLWGRIEEALAG